MDHRPFEDWLLNDARLTQAQELELREHLRTCQQCTALARGNFALRSAPVIAPADGFALRFQARLSAKRKAQRLQSLIGLILLSFVGIGGFIWLLFPYFPYLALPPGELASLWISNLIYLALTARALSAIGNTILNVLGSLVPTYIWVLSLALLGGMAFLWTISLHRVRKTVQSAA
ncbi:MAG TPA: hypothetical protein VGK00_05290 [Anaerolineales bacterium]|jgi:hypothetical protein